MIKFIPLVFIFLLISCSSEKDEQFCNCLKAGQELNDFSSRLFSEEITEAKAKQLKELKAKQKKECVDYQTMSGEEMLQKKSECK
jgi:uncharacterized membrane protein YheB (UPF0754 family)